MKIAIITDAWKPQINGVVTTLEQTVGHLTQMGQKVLLVTPEAFRTMPCPTYPSIRLSLRPAATMARILDRFSAKAYHIATEGPLGHAARQYCLANNLPFTTAFHTRFPEYIRQRAPVPLKLSYGYLRHFHRPASCTMVPTSAQQEALLDRGFKNVVLWGRGVDTDLFRPKEKNFYPLPGPISLYMGRVAREKNITAFLDLDLPGSKIVVGDGPDLERLKKHYPDVWFAGCRRGEELVDHLSGADVFVFPSRSDTFGLVMLEAMACGLPVAAYPVTGPIDVVTRKTGVLNEDLGQAVISALGLKPEDCRNYAKSRSWQSASEEFLANLTPISTHRAPNIDKVA